VRATKIDWLSGVAPGSQAATSSHTGCRNDTTHPPLAAAALDVRQATLEVQITTLEPPHFT